MKSVEMFQELFQDHLREISFKQEPKNLYEPINYILEIGGKRIRPVLSLMAASLFDTDPKEALSCALAVEFFHNFSLIHDDIMDAADLRRGKDTVHKKWDLNTGILSGDALLIKAYEQLEMYEPDTYKALMSLFNKTAIQVCEGQQWDVDFESKEEVNKSQYIQMIAYKTAVLLGASLQMGAIVAKASKEDGERIYQFGMNLGIAFQLQDDYLDAFGDPDSFGKRVGGDIVNNKKTILFIEAMSLANEADKKALLNWYSSTQDSIDKIESVCALFEQTGATQSTQLEIKEYTQKAFAALEAISQPERNKKPLKDLALALMHRSN